MDAARTQAEWTDLFTRFGMILKGAVLLRPIEQLFRRSDRVFVIEEDPQGNCSQWDLTGVIPGVNTDTNGKLYVRLVANGGDWDITIYKATGGGGGNAVCAATAVADGATATLTASNSSGITGTVVLDATVAGDVTDTHILWCFTALPTYAASVFDKTEQEDSAIEADLKAAFTQAANLIQQARTAIANVAKKPAFLGYMARILKVDKSQGLLNPTTENDDGVVTLTVTGLIEDLRDCMVNNTSGGALEQHVPANTLASGSVTYPTGNSGKGVLTAGTPAQNMVTGRVMLKCADQTMPDEEFDVTFESDDGETSLKGQNRLRVGKAWTDPRIQVALTLARTYAKTGDAGNADVAAATGCTFTGVTSDNSDDGVLYGKVTGSAGNWTYSFYKASSRLAADLVAQASGIAANGAFVATQQNHSGLTVSWTAGSGPTTGNTWSIDCQPWKTASTGTPADQMYFAITRSSVRSEWMEQIRELFEWYVNDDASPTIPEAVLTRGADLFPATIDE